MLDWIFEGIVGWVSSIVTQLMDAVSGLFLSALGTDMLAMEEYFPFVGKAFTVMQYTAWTLLFIITVWQLFRSFAGPIAEAENPWTLLIRSSLFGILIGFAKPIFLYVLKIARAPYTALMDLPLYGEVYLCRRGKCSEKRFGERCINGIGGGRSAYHDFVGATWLELLQTFA